MQLIGFKTVSKKPYFFFDLKLESALFALHLQTPYIIQPFTFWS